MTDQVFDHLLVAILASIPATVAAFSSLRNGQEQKKVRRELEQTNGKVSAIIGNAAVDDRLNANPRKRLPKKPADWYKPPDLS